MGDGFAAWCKNKTQNQPDRQARQERTYHGECKSSAVYFLGHVWYGAAKVINTRKALHFKVLR